jgi:hypothetical protein
MTIRFPKPSSKHEVSADYPERFGSLVDARTWAQLSFRGTTTQHHHSGIGFMTPAAVLWQGVAANRRHTLNAAYAAHQNVLKVNLCRPLCRGRVDQSTQTGRSASHRSRRGGACGQLGAQRRVVHNSTA